MKQDLDYTRTTKKSFDDVVSAVQEAAAKRNFRTLHIHDVRKTLADKGLAIGPYSIIEVCNAVFAHKVISTHKPVGMMLPCRIVVYAEAEENRIMLMKPTLISSMMPGVDFGTIPEDAEKTLMEVVDEAAK